MRRFLLLPVLAFVALFGFEAFAASSPHREMPKRYLASKADAAPIPPPYSMYSQDGRCFIEWGLELPIRHCSYYWEQDGFFYRVVDQVFEALYAHNIRHDPFKVFFQLDQLMPPLRWYSENVRNYTCWLLSRPYTNELDLTIDFIEQVEPDQIKPIGPFGEQRLSRKVGPFTLRAKVNQHRLTYLELGVQTLEATGSEVLKIQFDGVWPQDLASSPGGFMNCR